jgi:hypothetical protein
MKAAKELKMIKLYAKIYNTLPLTPNSFVSLHKNRTNHAKIHIFWKWK